MAPYTPPSVGRVAPMAMLGWGGIIGYPGDGGTECQNFRKRRCQSYRNRQEEIVRAYRGQAKVEEAFRRMKRPHFVSWTPMWHWTDQKIRVHAFYCVLALLLLSLLHREVKRSGRKLSIDGTMAKLAGIREVLLLGKGRRGRGLGVSTMLTERDRGQESLVELLGLREYAAGATTSAP